MKVQLLCNKNAHARDIEVFPYDEEYDQILSDLDAAWISNDKAPVGVFDLPVHSNTVLNLQCQYFLQLQLAQEERKEEIQLIQIMGMAGPRGEVKIRIKFRVVRRGNTR